VETHAVTKGDKEARVVEKKEDWGGAKEQPAYAAGHGNKSGVGLQRIKRV